ncbi:hypothetical protein CLAIMM_14216 [Cladophialophora immunda]|nr:hypothetical protein CLAIMM_14216 [Cladophialophora immunda]
MEDISNPVLDAKGQPNSVPVGLSKAQMDIMWQMGVASFTANKNELVIPYFMAINLSEANITDLRSRFSAYFNNAPAAILVDHSAEVCRIRLAHELPATGNGLPDMSSSPPRSASDQSMMSTSSPTPAPKRARLNKGSPVKSIRLPGKKSKVPRPPNAFILYRAKHHPTLKDVKPALSNNEISVILGKRWREESEQVRAQFKELADNIKVQHAAENPGYQYAPRKPSEKKRRMTARKLAASRAAKAETESQSGSDLEMTDVTEIDEAERHGSKAMDEAARGVSAAPHFFGEGQEISATWLMGSERAHLPSHIRHGHQGEMSVILPAGHSHVEHDYATKMARFQHVTAADEMVIGVDDEATTRYHSGPFARATWSSVAADDFMSSLVDWDAIKADALLVHESLKPAAATTATTTATNQHQHRHRQHRHQQQPLENFQFDSSAERAKFQAELDRVLWMLE